MPHGITSSAMNVRDRLIDLTLGKPCVSTCPHHVRPLRIEHGFEGHSIFHKDNCRGL
jgi:hypothetical protein